MSKFDTQLALLPNKKLSTIDVDLTKFSATASNLLGQAERAEITDEDSYAKGGDLIKIARGESSKVEDLRKKLSAPYHKVWKFINENFNLTKGEFDRISATIEPKMLAWKREEDKRLAAEAAKEAARIEEEALAKAALESTDEAQDEVMDAAADAAVEIVENSGQQLARGSYGSSTGTRKVYSTQIVSTLDFLRGIVKHFDEGNKRELDIGSLVEFRQAGLNKLAKDMIAQGVKRMPGAEFKVSDKIRVY